MDLSKYRWSKNGITLRPAVADDWEHFYNNYFDSETRFMFYTEAEWPENRETAKERFGKFIVSLREKGGMSFACENENGDVIGSLDLYAVDMRNGTFQIAVMVSKEHRGKGYAKKMLDILLEYCFCELRLNKYNARVVAPNAASKQLHLSLGCTLEGIHREMYFHDGEYVDEYFFGLTAAEWRARNFG